MTAASFFVQNLTMRAWCISIWPRLMRTRFLRAEHVAHCYVLDGSKPALGVAKITGLLAGVDVSRFIYSLVDIRDEDGLQTRIKVEAYHLNEIRCAIVSTPEFHEAFSANPPNSRLPLYVAKMAVGNEPSLKSVIWQTLITLQVCAWKSRCGPGKSANCTVFIENRNWINEIRVYAERLGITAVPVSAAVNVGATIRGGIPPRFRSFLRMVRYRLLRKRTLAAADRRQTGESLSQVRESDGYPDQINSKGSAQHGDPKVAVDYYGQLNLDRPELSSELFFWQQSRLSVGDVLLNLRFPSVGLTSAAWQELDRTGISTVAMHPGATGGFDIPVFKHGKNVKLGTAYLNNRNRSSKDSRWISKQIDSYQAERSIWSDFFDQNNVKVYSTWYRNGPSHCAIADALQALGGVTAIYQRSFESYKSAVMTMASDIAFEFSRSSDDLEFRFGADVPYRVVTGFLGDHRFALLKDSEKGTREKLRSNGARWIAAYFDENTTDDPRWYTGHQFTQENYAFLLEKVLTDPEFGLVLKPRTPQGLRRRLGPVAEILREAIDTGRCHIYESGTIRGAHTPAAAALASDFAIHGHLYAGSAGMESALAGVPTLLLDREGWHKSPLYKLGVGKVVFTDWESLWESAESHRSGPRADSGFGDWSPILDELDPFRDGLAAKRMGTYIHRLLEGFRNGLDRETVMADAAERYCAEWGVDKVTEVRTGLPSASQHLSTVGN